MKDIMGKWVFLNGNPVSSEKVVASWQSRSENRLIYEVVRLVEGIPLFIEDYLQRLRTSHALMNLSPPANLDEIPGNIRILAQLNGILEGPVKIILSQIPRELFLIYHMMPHLPEPWEYISGVKTVLMHAFRSNPNVKVWNSELREASVKLLKENKAYEALLVDKLGRITEGSRSNVFFIRGEELVTIRQEYVLPGITRKKVLDVCQANHIVVRMELVRASDLGQFDAAFLTGTARKIVPIRSIGEITYTTDHHLLQQVKAGFEKLVDEYLRNNR